MTRRARLLIAGLIAFAVAGISLMGCVSFPDAQRVRELEAERAELTAKLTDCKESYWKKERPEVFAEPATFPISDIDSCNSKWAVKIW